jgi:gamma-glutamyl phosphate reductase
VSHTQTIAREVAEAELDRFLEAMDLKIKTESSRLDAEDQKRLKDVKENLVDAIMAMRLVIDEEGCAIFTPRVGDISPIKFEEPSGSDLMQMDKAKAGHNVAKQNLLLGAITKQGPQRFANMKQRDLSVCSDLMVLFLA